MSTGDELRRIDYDALLEVYERRLQEELRGFAGASAGLETWVPDADLTSSLSGLLDAVAEAGEPGVVVVLTPELFSSLDEPAWQALAARHGTLSILAGETQAVLEFRFTQSASGAPVQAPRVERRQEPEAPAPSAAQAEAPRLRDALRPAVLEAAASARHVSGEAPRDASWVSISHQGWHLHVLANEEHCITAARHDGAADAEERGVLELLCRVGIGLPVVEWAEHGALRLLAAAQSEGPLVPGVVQPENASALIARANALVRFWLADYRAKNAYSAPHSEYEPPASREWQEATEDERLARLALELPDAAQRAGFGHGEVTLVALREGSRVVVDVRSQLKTAQRGECLLALEGELARSVEASLTLELEALPDESSLRRLRVDPGVR